MQKGLKKLATIPLYILGFILMGLLSGYLAFKILSFSRTVEVPDLKGKTLVEANALLSRGGLYLKVEGEDYDPVIIPGRIVRQDVPAGNKVKEQRSIKVLLSKGPKATSIPELVGQTLEESEPDIRKSRLRIEKIIHVHSTAFEKDRIIAQSPDPDEAGGTSKKPEEILEEQHGLFLIVSSGSYESVYYCPDFTGKTKEEAAALADKLGLSVEFSGSGERVKSQKPKPNAHIKSGETIHLHLEGEIL